VNTLIGGVSAIRSSSLLFDCGATAHIIMDKFQFTKFDESFCPEKQSNELPNGTKSNVALQKET